jgi:flavin-dependent dehydrogenase
VIGGGPAGATTASLLARRGVDVLLLEKSAFPRFHIGESLIPETYWTLERLGMIQKLEASDFPRKYSVQFVSGNGKESAPFYFHKFKPAKSSITWQVLRSRFDSMLLDNAREHGAEVRQSTRVRNVLFEERRAVGVALAANGRSEETIRASVVVDATGQSSFMARKLDLKRPDRRLRKAAIFAHFRGAHRDSGIDEGATLIIYVRENLGWFWYIPLPDDLVSVGLVGDPGFLIAGRGDDPAKTFFEEIDLCPALRSRLSKADIPSKVHVANDFSYGSSEIAGDGWVSVGDALGFLDPIYSSGVFLALVSGEMAADAIYAALRKGDTSGAVLSTFRGRLESGLDAFRNIIYAFYTPGFSFKRFLEHHPDHHGNLVSLLMGDVFRPEVHEIFTPLSQYCESVHSTTLAVGERPVS